MNTYNKILLSILLTTSFSNLTMTKNVKNELSPEDQEKIAEMHNLVENRSIEMQFAPDYYAPFTNQPDDQYMAEFLRLFINLDKEVFHDPDFINRMKNKEISVVTIQNLAIGISQDYALSSQDKSFGWNAPGAILYSIFTKGDAYTPNIISIAAGPSKDFPGKLEFKFKGKGIYENSEDINKEAHYKLAHFLKTIPPRISKYANLEEITTIEELSIPHKPGQFDPVKKSKLKNKIPTLQGEIKTKCNMGICDVFGTIICHPIVLAYLEQEHNGNRYKSNSIQKLPSQHKINSPAITKPTTTIDKPTLEIKTEDNRNEDDYDRLFTENVIVDDNTIDESEKRQNNETSEE